MNTANPPKPKIKLSKLRDIGWGLWDPIRLIEPGAFYPGKWGEEENLPFADEYDAYLMSAASQLRQGVSPERVIDYLIDIENSHMGLGQSRTTRTRAAAVVGAILADKDIWS